MVDILIQRHIDGKPVHPCMTGFVLQCYDVIPCMHKFLFVFFHYWQFDVATKGRSYFVGRVWRFIKL